MLSVSCLSSESVSPIQSPSSRLQSTDSDYGGEEILSPSLEEMNNPTLSRFFEYGYKWTFQMPKLRRWVEERLEGRVLNLFGGKVRLTHPNGDEIVHNEIDTNLEADIRLDACDLEAWRDHAGSFDTVVFDPPYSAHQAVVSYGNRRAQKVSHARDVVSLVLKPRGRVISLAFNSTGMNMKRGFKKEELLIVNCGASHNDYLVLVERRIR